MNNFAAKKALETRTSVDAEGKQPVEEAKKAA